MSVDMSVLDKIYDKLDVIATQITTVIVENNARDEKINDLKDDLDLVKEEVRNLTKSENARNSTFKNIRNVAGIVVFITVVFSSYITYEEKAAKKKEQHALLVPSPLQTKKIKELEKKLSLTKKQ